MGDRSKPIATADPLLVNVLIITRSMPRLGRAGTLIAFVNNYCMHAADQSE